MKPRHVLSIVVGVAVLAVGVYVAVNRPWFPADASVKTAGLNIPPSATQIPHYGTEYGAITASLTSPDNVTFRVVAIQRGTNEWMFHLHAHNNTGSSVPVLDANANHYFVLAGKGIPGTPYTFEQLTVRLASPGQAVAGEHPALSSFVPGGADADGWLVADLSNYKNQPYQLLYVYGTVTAPACTNPRDQSTCHPSTGYRTIVWNL